MADWMSTGTRLMELTPWTTLSFDSEYLCFFRAPSQSSASASTFSREDSTISSNEINLNSFQCVAAKPAHVSTHVFRARHRPASSVRTMSGCVDIRTLNPSCSSRMRRQYETSDVSGSRTSTTTLAPAERSACRLLTVGGTCCLCTASVDVAHNRSMSLGRSQLSPWLFSAQKLLFL